MTIHLPRRQLFTFWPDEKQRHNLVADSAFIDDQGRVVAAIRSLDGHPIRFEDEMPQSKLAKLLTRMLRTCAQHPGHVERKDLPSGLRIDLIVSPDGNTRILLARRGVYPSQVELKTVLDHLPFAPALRDPADPEYFTHKSWYCLRLAWPTLTKDKLT